MRVVRSAFVLKCASAANKGSRTAQHRRESVREEQAWESERGEKATVNRLARAFAYCPAHALAHALAHTPADSLVHTPAHKQELHTPCFLLGALSSLFPSSAVHSPH